jgi:hypothetical protein
VNFKWPETKSYRVYLGVNKHKFVVIIS